MSAEPLVHGGAEAAGARAERQIAFAEPLPGDSTTAPGGKVCANVACAGEGVAPDGRVVYRDGRARYVHVLEAGSKTRACLRTWTGRKALCGGVLANADDTADHAPSTTDGFGAPCTDVSACGAPTDDCAVTPGQTTGYCTRKGCAGDPSA